MLSSSFFLSEIFAIMHLDVLRHGKRLFLRVGGFAAILPNPPLWAFIRGRRCAMSDYELLMIVFTVIGIVISSLKSNNR